METSNQSSLGPGLSMEQIYNMNIVPPSSTTVLFKGNSIEFDQLCISYIHEDLQQDYYFPGIQPDTLCSSMRVIAKTNEQICDIITNLNKELIAFDFDLIWKAMENKVMTTIILDVSQDGGVFEVAQKTVPQPSALASKEYQVADPN